MYLYILYFPSSEIILKDKYAFFSEVTKVDLAAFACKLFIYYMFSSEIIISSHTDSLQFLLRLFSSFLRFVHIRSIFQSLEPYFQAYTVLFDDASINFDYFG